MRALLIQTRMSSKRFPGKMLVPIIGKVPLVEYVYRRSQTSKRAGVVAVITSTDKTDDVLFAYCQDHGIKAFRGALDNVLDRYIKAAEFFKADVVCRVCGDSPFVDTALIDSLFDMLAGERLDYAAPDRNTCASGFYSEVFTLPALKKAAKLTESSEDLENVTKFILESKDEFAIKLIDAGLNPEFAKKVRFTIDYPEDIDVGNALAAKLPDDYSFNSRDVLKIIKAMNLCAA